MKAITAKSEGSKKIGELMKYYYDILHDPIEFQKFKDDAARSHQRRLQGGGILELQNVTFDGCLFENNGHGPESLATFDGMINVASPSNELHMRDTIFRNNIFTNSVKGVSFVYVYS